MSQRAWRAFVSIAAAALVLGIPQSADACPVCFGAEGSPLVDAARTGVLVMLGVTVVVLGGFAAFFRYLLRQSRRAQADGGTSS